MDNRTIGQVRANETKLIYEIDALETKLKKQKEIINDIKDLEIYRQNGGTYIIPVEVMNDIFGEIEDVEV